MRAASIALLLFLSVPAAAREAEEPPPVTQEPEGFRIGGEIKAGFRWSQPQQSSIFGANNRIVGFMRTPDAGGSFEFQHLAIAVG